MKSKISVLHLIDSGGLYGAENVIINLSVGLRKSGHTSIIGCFRYKGRLKPEVGNRALELGLDTTFFEMKNKMDLTCVKKIAQYCQANKIQIIHSHGYKPSMICLLLKLLYRIPYVVTCHLWFLRNLRLKIYAFFEKLCMLKAESVVGVSQDIVDNLIKVGVPPGKLTLIYNGIEVEALSRIAMDTDIDLRHKLSLQQGSFIIGSLGRLTEQKDYKTFIKAAAEVLKEEKDIEFIVAGEGHLKSELISLTEQLEIKERFHLIGYQKDIPSLLSLMDIFVLSSLDEGLPIALLEAMAAKCAIVTTAVGAIPSVITNGVNGRIFKKKDFINLKDILLYLKRNSKQRKELAVNAFDLVNSKFSNDQMTKKYFDIYDSAIHFNAN